MPKSASEKLVDGIMRLLDLHVKSVNENKAAGQMGLYAVTLRTLITILVKDREGLLDQVALMNSHLADAERRRKVLMAEKERWRLKSRRIISNRKVLA